MGEGAKVVDPRVLGEARGPTQVGHHVARRVVGRLRGGACCCGVRKDDAVRIGRVGIACGDAGERASAVVIGQPHEAADARERDLAGGLQVGGRRAGRVDGCVLQQHVAHIAADGRSPEHRDAVGGTSRNAAIGDAHGRARKVGHGAAGRAIAVVREVLSARHDRRGRYAPAGGAQVALHRREAEDAVLLCIGAGGGRALDTFVGRYDLVNDDRRNESDHHADQCFDETEALLALALMKWGHGVSALNLRREREVVR
ncbi:hypothetical protein D3C86_1104070 [compost metagenome]